MPVLKPKLLIIAGPNGSGKTSITWKILKHEWVDDCVYINPDEIARDKFGDWNSPDAILKAAGEAAAIREECLIRKNSLIFETVMSASDKIDYILRAKQAGFFIRLFFVGTDHPSINAARVAHRVMEGGHDVPIPKIISRYTRSIANCSTVIKCIDRGYIYDNSIDYQEPTLLFRTKDGSLEKIYDSINPWANIILSNITK